MSESEPNESFTNDDTMRILVASDIHLGYNEKDPIRGDDSFVAFEEILQHAVHNEVDFILLGGDLFHDARPTPNTLQKCLKLLRTYTLGDKAISINIVSDQAVNFYDSLSRSVNYEDPNINIAYPVFSIHGNHDDPSGFGRLSSLDLLSTSGMINYFGKWVDLTKISISPILIRKGKTQLAMYGLSHIHDCRLARLFHDSKVIMEKPGPETGKWFNVMVLHQNRADRGPKNYLPEEILPEFLDLVIWGHEHDCRIIPEENAIRKFFVSQPGSSVATSLAEGESLDKHIGLLLIRGEKFKLEPIKLQSVRPFIFESICLADYVDELEVYEGDTSEKVQQFTAAKVAEMLRKAEEKYTKHPEQPKEPLIRLRLLYAEEEQMFNAIRFGQQYNTTVANPMDMVLFKRMIKKTKSDPNCLDEEVMEQVYDREHQKDEIKVEDIVDRYFKEVESKPLEVLSSKCLSEFCRRMVESADDDAADSIIKFNIDRACEFLNNKMPGEHEYEEALAQFRLKEDDTFQSMLKMLDERGQKKRNGTRATVIESDSDDDLLVLSASKFDALISVSSTSSSDQKGIRGGRGSRGGRGRASASRGRGSRGGRGATAAAQTAVTPAPLQVNVSARQPTIDVAMSQPRTSTRAKPTVKKTQYLSDSD